MPVSNWAETLLPKVWLLQTAGEIYTNFVADGIDEKDVLFTLRANRNFVATICTTVHRLSAAAQQPRSLPPTRRSLHDTYQRPGQSGQNCHLVTVIYNLYQHAKRIDHLHSNLTHLAVFVTATDWFARPSSWKCDNKHE